jgi:hypothetical protein
MKPVALRELYQYAPILDEYDDVEMMVPETLHTRLVATRAAYLAVCEEINQFKEENS